MITEEVFEVPLGGGAQGAFEADEEGMFAVVGEFAEALDGGVVDVLVPREADEGAAARVADFIDGSGVGSRS